MTKNGPKDHFLIKNLLLFLVFRNFDEDKNENGVRMTQNPKKIKRPPAKKQIPTHKKE